MGQWSEFECTKCDYEAVVSGGADTGFLGHVHTAICRTCRPPRLVDAPLFPDAYAERSTRPEDYRCPHARTRVHKLELWTAPGPCPRCDGQMRLKPLGNIILWD
jgi:hypothetical protein